MDTLQTILSNTYTISDLRHRVRILRSFLESNLFSDGSFLASQSLEDANWLKSLSANFTSEFNVQNFYQKFEGLEEAVKKIIPLTIYLSFSADREVINQIGAWIRQNLAQSIIFEIKLDPNILGGSALSWKGIYKDYSLRARVEDSKEAILAEFKKYVR